MPLQIAAGRRLGGNIPLTSPYTDLRVTARVAVGDDGAD